MNIKCNIFYCSTVYHVLLASLFAYQFKEEKNILVVDVTSFGAGKDLIKYKGVFFEEIYPLLENDISLNKIEYLNYKNNISNKIEKIVPELAFYRKNQKNVFCYICEDDHHYSRYFVYNYNNLVMLEEGLKIYNDISKYESYIKRVIKYRILGINYANGVDKRIKELWVQYPERLPNNVKQKGRKINLNQMMDAVYGKSQMKSILEMLGINNLLWKELNCIFTNKQNENIILLITQPFSEDGFLCEKEKIEIYKKIIKLYSQNAKLVIKPHPREKTDYKKIFNNAVVLDNSFPLELLHFIKCSKKINVAITINSTAVLNIEDICQHVRVIGKCDLTKSISDFCSLKKGYYK